jgi:hypothetical protein
MLTIIILSFLIFTVATLSLSAAGSKVFGQSSKDNNNNPISALSSKSDTSAAATTTTGGNSGANGENGGSSGQGGNNKGGTGTTKTTPTSSPPTTTTTGNGNPPPPSPLVIKCKSGEVLKSDICIPKLNSKTVPIPIPISNSKSNSLKSSSKTKRIKLTPLVEPFTPHACSKNARFIMSLGCVKYHLSYSEAWNLGYQQSLTDGPDQENYVGIGGFKHHSKAFTQGYNIAFGIGAETSACAPYLK